MQNGFCESFNRAHALDELLNESLFLSLDHARTKITNWVDDYNQRRPHSRRWSCISAPAAYAANLSATRGSSAQSPTSSADRAMLAPPAPHGLKPAEALIAFG